jgi:hypothetical protein
MIGSATAPARLVRFALLPALAALGLAATGAGAQQAAPGTPARGFDAPKQALTLSLPNRGAVAGLAPGQDLVGTAPLDLALSPVDLDRVAGASAYRQALTQYFPRHPLGTGKNLAGLGLAGATALTLKAEDALADRLQDEIKDRIEAGDLPEAAGYGLGIARAAASAAIALAAVRPK